MNKVYGFACAGTMFLVASIAQAAFILPDSATSPFEDWSRSDDNSTYAEWGTGATAPTGFSDNSGAAGVQDIDSPNSHFMAGTADVIETTGTSFLTSGFNIYSFSAATDFDVTIPGYGYGAGWNTRFVAQLHTLGNELDLPSVRLSFDGGGQGLLPNSYTELSRGSAGGGFGGGDVEHLLVWDIEGFNPAEFLLEFNAAASSMSLDVLAIDTFTQAVPEPATLLLGGLSVLGLTPQRRRG